MGRTKGSSCNKSCFLVTFDTFRQSGDLFVLFSALSLTDFHGRVGAWHMRYGHFVWAAVYNEFITI